MSRVFDLVMGLLFSVLALVKTVQYKQYKYMPTTPVVDCIQGSTRRL